jgi:peptidoglycan/xylan/chitin deacetylase (PgdA/CDA1 family)
MQEKNYIFKQFGLWFALASLFLCIGLTIAHQNSYKQALTTQHVFKKPALVVSNPVKPYMYPKRPVVNINAVQVPILMYHHVGTLPEKADLIRKDLTVSTSDFESEVKYLSDAGYHSVSLSDVYQASLKEQDLPSRPVVFTFDDGYSDVFENAVPILLKYGFTGSFAIITNFPGRDGYASWDQIKQAHSNGMEIVSHTQDHFDGSNPKYKADEIYKNLLNSRQDILDHVGVDTNIIIYPFGHSTAMYREEAQKAGFVMGLTVEFGREVDPKNLMLVPRVRVHGIESLEGFIKSL